MRICKSLKIVLFLFLNLGLIADGVRHSRLGHCLRPIQATQEQIRWRHESNGVRALILSPLQLQNQRRCLIIYATPNGNTLEETLGCLKSEQTSWRFDIQHVAAQIRWLRNQDPATDYIVAVVQAANATHPNGRMQPEFTDRKLALVKVTFLDTWEHFQSNSHPGAIHQCRRITVRSRNG